MKRYVNSRYFIAKLLLQDKFNLAIAICEECKSQISSVGIALLQVLQSRTADFIAALAERALRMVSENSRAFLLEMEILGRIWSIHAKRVGTSYMQETIGMAIREVYRTNTYLEVRINVIIKGRLIPPDLNKENRWKETFFW